ncbi:MAG: serine protease [bacterium]|nr:serine protease [bacterium]
MVQISYSEIYKKVKPSIVAIVARLSTNKFFPDIIGTGFLCREDGLVMTNEHVIKAISKLPRLKSMTPNDWPAMVIYFQLRPDGMLPITIPIVGAFRLGGKLNGINYGEDLPDVGFLKIPVKDLPKLDIEEIFSMQEGDGILVSGFPMGTRTLTAPGWLHQIGPTLETGIISALIPFPCDRPQGVVLDVMIHGGSSGSPIINPSNGKVAGLIYGGLTEEKILNGPNGFMSYENNTSITVGLPSNVLDMVLKTVNQAKPDLSDIHMQTLEEFLADKEIKTSIPKVPDTGKPIQADEIIANYNKSRF